MNSSWFDLYLDSQQPLYSSQSSDSHTVDIHRSGLAPWCHGLWKRWGMTTCQLLACECLNLSQRQIQTGRIRVRKLTPVGYMDAITCNNVLRGKATDLMC